MLDTKPQQVYTLGPMREINNTILHIVVVHVTKSCVFGKDSRV